MADQTFNSQTYRHDGALQPPIAMKKYFFSSLLFACVCCTPTLPLAAQARVYGLTNMNEVFTTAVPVGTDAEFYYAVGTSYPNNPTSFNSTITKIRTDAAMTWVWTREFQGPNGESLALNDVQESVTGNLIVVGNAFPGTNGLANNRYVVMEINKETGAVIQSRYYTRPGNNRQLNPRIVRVSDCGATCGGAYIVCSWIDSPGADNVFAMKLDQSLNIVWASDYDTGGDDEPAGLISTPSGGAVIAGSSSTGGWRTFLLELDCSGSVVAGRTYAYAPTQGYNFLCYGITRAFNDDILVCGAAEVTSGGRSATVTRILNTTLNDQWTKMWNTTPSMVFTGITQLKANNGNVYAAAYVPDATFGGFEPRVVKFSFVSGGSNQYNDFGGVGGSFGGRVGISANKTRLLIANGKTVAPAGAGIGLNDAFLTVQPSGLNKCDPATSIALTSLNLNPNPIAFTTASVTLVDSILCNGTNLQWSSKDVCSVTNLINNPDDGKGVRAARPTSGLGFEIFPNPAAETVEITIESDGETPEVEHMVQIFDSMGKLVKTHTAVVGEQTSLDLRDLPKGIYSVKIGDSPAQKLTLM